MARWSILCLLLITIFEEHTASTQTHRRLTRQTTSQTTGGTCDETNTLQKKTFFCAPVSYTNITALVPYAALVDDQGNKGVSGKGYNWFLMMGQQWTSLVAETGYNWKSWSAGVAKTLRPQIQLSKKTEHLLIVYKPTNPQIGCLTLYLSPYYYNNLGYSRNPQFKVVLCFQNQTQVNVSPHARQAGARVVTPTATLDDWFSITTGLSQTSNNWLLLVEQSAGLVHSDCVACLEARPLLKVVPAAISPYCIVPLFNTTAPGENCSQYAQAFPVVANSKNNPMFDKNVAPGNYTCFNLSGTGQSLGHVNASWCKGETLRMVDKPLARADVWIWCGTDVLYDSLPRHASGLCAVVSLLLPLRILPISAEDLESEQTPTLKRRKREYKSWRDNDPTYIDAIGVPRGVPDEYKLADQVLAGFESLALWVTPNKNVDRINYIHYNVQRLGNHTEEALKAVHDQLKATSLMAFQNRIAVDMLLAEKGGVCHIFGDQCCTFIPNNTAPGGTLTRALEGLKVFNKRLKEQSGIDNPLSRMLESWFGRWKNVAMTILITLIVVCSVFVFCGCCCVPLIRSMCERTIQAMVQKETAYQLLQQDGEGEYAAIPTAPVCVNLRSLEEPPTGDPVPSRL